MASPAIDYDALAKQHGGTPAVDYDSLAAQHGGASAQESQVPLGDQPASFSGVAQTMWDQAKGVAEGAWKGIKHTVSQTPTPYMNYKTPPARPDLAPTTTPEKIGYGVEQAAEFMAPGGIEAKAGKAVEAMTKLPAARALGKAIIQGISAGTVAGAQTGGDPTAMRNAALAAGGTSAVIQGVKAAIPSASRLYQSALKPAPSMDAAEREAIIKTGLKEGLVLNGDVVQNAQKKIDDINNQISQEIATRSSAGATVDPVKVAKYTDRSAGRALNQVNPEADVNAVQGAKSEFLRTNSVDAPFTTIAPMPPDQGTGYFPTGKGANQIPQDIPLEQAQRMKQGTYAKLKGSYGEGSSASREAQKDLARGLKDQIAQAFPEITQLNAREGALLRLEASLERFVGREGNKELIGIGTPMTTLAAHAAGIPAVPAMLTSMALKDSAIRSRLAIALAKAAAGKPGAGIATVQGAATLAPKAAAYGVTPGGQQRTEPPPQ